MRSRTVIYVKIYESEVSVVHRVHILIFFSSFRSLQVKLVCNIFVVSGTRVRLRIYDIYFSLSVFKTS